MGHGKARAIIRSQTRAFQSILTNFQTNKCKIHVITNNPSANKPNNTTVVGQKGKLSKIDMLKTFKCGAGFAIFVPDDEQAAKTLAIAAKLGYEAVQAGVILPSSAGRQLIVEPLSIKLTDEQFLLQKS